MIAAFGVNSLMGQSSKKSQKKDAKKNQSKDHDFVSKALLSSISEVNFGELALSNSQSDDIKEFAKMMIDDHERINLELTQLAQQNGYEKIPHQLSESGQEKLQDIQNVYGNDFDQAYIDMMVISHLDTVELFRTQSRIGKDDAIKSWALKNLSLLERHLDHAKEIQENLKNN